MCYGGKCLHCISLEVGCLILGYFQTVVFGVMMMFLIGFDTEKWRYDTVTSRQCIDWSWSDNKCNQITYRQQSPEIYRLRWNTQAIPMSVLFFVFSALLVYGVHKKKSSLIMAYFAFGVVSLVVSMMYFLELTIIGELGAIAGLLIGVIYSHLLVMVYQTAKKIDLEDANTDQRSLAGPSTRCPTAPPPYGKVGDGDALEV